MHYTNPKIPEGINTSKEHPLKEFIILTAGVLGGIAVILIVLALMADKLACYIPFSVESNITYHDISDEITDKPINDYLNKLGDRVVAAADLPEGMTIKIHYVDSDIVNAFATLGGNVVMFRGLLKKIPNENALAMVLAHEVAHIKYRHPIRSLGRGVAITLFLSLFSTSGNGNALNGVITQTGTVTVLKFSRDQELEADQEGLRIVKKMYGHVNGAEDLFYVLNKEDVDMQGYEFFRSHPLTKNRIHQVEQLKNEIHTSNKKKTPLPENYMAWLKAGAQYGQQH